MSDIQKPVIKRHKYDRFRRKYKKGSFGTQCFGEAFYAHFKLHRLEDQTVLNNIHAKDGDHAKRSIEQIFEFN